MIFDRDANEKRTDAAIRAYFRRAREQWAAVIASGREPSKGFIRGQEELLIAILLRRSVAVALASARDIVVANDLDRGLIQAVADPVGKKLLADAKRDAASIVRTTQDRMGTRSELRDPDFRRDRLATLFSPERAEGLAITHTTSSRSAGQTTIAYLLGDGVEKDWEWQTSEDGRVCPICRPLNGKLSAVWRLVAPGGPPAHPRCRCDLILRMNAKRRGR